MRIIIIGRGNVATNLEAAFRRQHIEIEMVSSREGLEQIPQNADVYIYAVQDAALAEVVAKVSVPQRALHMHTSGTMSMDVFGPDKPHAGVFYPFQTFSKENLIEDFTKVPIFFEAKGIDDISAIYSLALAITPHVYETTQEDRRRLHVAGVFANNFTNMLFAYAAELLKDTHIPFAALFPLMEETVRKARTIGPKEAQTGPARRHDDNVLARHLKEIPSDEMREVYQLLTDAIQKRYPKE